MQMHFDTSIWYPLPSNAVISRSASETCSHLSVLPNFDVFNFLFKQACDRLQMNDVYKAQQVLLFTEFLLLKAICPRTSQSQTQTHARRANLQEHVLTASPRCHYGSERPLRSVVIGLTSTLMLLPYKCHFLNTVIPIQSHRRRISSVPAPHKNQYSSPTAAHPTAENTDGNPPQYQYRFLCGTNRYRSRFSTYRYRSHFRSKVHIFMYACTSPVSVPWYRAVYPTPSCRNVSLSGMPAGGMQHPTF